MKILILRFSSIGDIVLTTPLLRCLKKQRNDIEIHYLLKEKYREILEYNPHINKLHFFKNSINEVLNDLKNQNFDLIIDLHNNLRTKILKNKLKIKSYSFNKLNIYKWLYVNFKINKLPNIHIVDRYFETIKKLNVFPDNLNCEYYIQDININISEKIPEKFIIISVGAQYFTKQIPVNKICEIIKLLPEYNFILLGDKNDYLKAEEVKKQINSQKLINLCGKMKLNESVSFLKNSKLIITGDSGLMHIASCFSLPIISLWGNTVPDFGMYPYYPNNDKLYKINEIKDLKCRPCSKIGFSKCPKGHFSCMNKQNIMEIVSQVKLFYER